MRIGFEKAARDGLARKLASHLKDDFGIEIGGMDAVLLLDFIAETVGPHFYNQGLYDAQALLHTRLEAIGEAILELEKPARL